MFYFKCAHANKRMYVTQQEAEEVRVAQIKLNKKLYLRTYICPDCKHYHLTRKKLKPNGRWD